MNINYPASINLIEYYNEGRGVFFKIVGATDDEIAHGRNVCRVVYPPGEVVITITYDIGGNWYNTTRYTN